MVRLAISDQFEFNILAIYVVLKLREMTITVQ